MGHREKKPASETPFHSGRPQSLRRRLLTLLGVVLLVTLLVIGAGVSYFVFLTEQKAWQGRQGEAARNAVETVAAFIQHLEDSLTLVSLLDYDYLTAEPQVMHDLLQQNPAFLEMVCLDARGKVFASAYQDAPLLANLFTIPQSTWFLQAGAGELYLGNIQISPAGDPYLIIAVPAPDGAVVAGRLRMSVLWDVVAAIRFGETGRAYVVNREGRIVAHTKPEVVLANTSLAGRPELVALLQSLGHKWNGAYVNFEGTSVVGTMAPVPGTGWVVITELSQAEAFAVSRTAGLLLGGGMLLFGVVVMWVTASLLGRLIFQPMERLRAGAERIGQGDLRHRIDIARQDEVGQVAESFNEMVGRLREREDQLAARTAALAAEVAERKRAEEALRRAHDELEMRVQERTTELAKASEALRAEITERKQAEEALRRRAEELDVLQATVLDITAPHDLPTLLQAIVKRAALLLDAPGGGLYLCDPDQEETRCVVSYNTLRDYTGTVLKYGEGAAGIVAQTGEPLIIDDYRTWSGRAAAYEEEQPFTAVLSAPMIWQGQVTGVIHVLHDVGTRRFTQADLGLLALFANHAAIAVENTRLYQETQQRALQQETLRETALALTTALDRNQVIERILSQLQQVVPYDSASVQLLQGDRLVIIGGHGFPNLPDLLGISFPADGDNPNREVMRTLSPFILKDAPAVYEVFREEPHRQIAIRSWLGVPMLIGEQLVGMIALDKCEPGFYTQEHARLAEAFAAQAAIAIENARLFEEIEERRLYLEGVLGSAPDAIVTLDDRFQVVEWNTGAERLFGYSREEAVGQHLDHLVTSPDVLKEAIGFTQRVLGGKELPPTEAVRYRKDGSPVDVIVAGSPIFVGDELIGAVAVYTDITARVRMEETLRALALLDELTGLYNRRGFSILAEQQLKMAHRAKRRMVLLFADFNGLKRINDAFGHPEGDRALIEAAEALEETFRESDVIARFGGDEFVVLAIETNGSPAEVLTARLQENLEVRNAREGRRYELSLSVGLAHYDPGHPCSIDELVAQADRAMYERKRDNQKA